DIQLCNPHSQDIKHCNPPTQENAPLQPLPKLNPLSMPETGRAENPDSSKETGEPHRGSLKETGDPKHQSTVPMSETGSDKPIKKETAPRIFSSIMELLQYKAQRKREADEAKQLAHMPSPKTFETATSRTANYGTSAISSRRTRFAATLFKVGVVMYVLEKEKVVFLDICDNIDNISGALDSSDCTEEEKLEQGFCPAGNFLLDLFGFAASTHFILHCSIDPELLEVDSQSITKQFIYAKMKFLAVQHSSAWCSARKKSKLIALYADDWDETILLKSTTVESDSSQDDREAIKEANSAIESFTWRHFPTNICQNFTVHWPQVWRELSENEELQAALLKYANERNVKQKPQSPVEERLAQFLRTCNGAPEVFCRKKNSATRPTQQVKRSAGLVHAKTEEFQQSAEDMRDPTTPFQCILKFAEVILRTGLSISNPQEVELKNRCLETSLRGYTVLIWMRRYILLTLRNMVENDVRFPMSTYANDFTGKYQLPQSEVNFEKLLCEVSFDAKELAEKLALNAFERAGETVSEDAFITKYKEVIQKKTSMRPGPPNDASVGEKLCRNDPDPDCLRQQAHIIHCMLQLEETNLSKIIINIQELRDFIVYQLRNFLDLPSYRAVLGLAAQAMHEEHRMRNEGEKQQQQQEEKVQDMNTMRRQEQRLLEKQQFGELQLLLLRNDCLQPILDTLLKRAIKDSDTPTTIFSHVLTELLLSRVRAHAIDQLSRCLPSKTETKEPFAGCYRSASAALMLYNKLSAVYFRCCDSDGDLSLDSEAVETAVKLVLDLNRFKDQDGAELKFQTLIFLWNLQETSGLSLIDAKRKHLGQNIGSLSDVRNVKLYWHKRQVADERVGFSEEQIARLLLFLESNSDTDKVASLLELNFAFRWGAKHAKDFCELQDERQKLWKEAKLRFQATQARNARLRRFERKN
uniref:TPR_REGION domain-containing protein n=1 Tax=Macrostomum lignano TaxID=282301 RepID=A0A1I8HK39_9PLAT